MDGSLIQDHYKVTKAQPVLYAERLLNLGDKYATVRILKLTRERRQMDKIFQKIIDKNFSDLKGTTVDASIPVPQSLINELIEAALKVNKSSASVRATVQPQNRVSLDVKTTVLPWPLNLKLKLDRSVDLASFASPKLRAWMENNRLLGSMGSLFNALPAGIKLYGDQVVIDLGAFLRTPEQKQILELVKSIGIRTEPGKLVLDVKAEVS